MIMETDYSQYGESKTLTDIFDKIGLINKFAVEFGASDGIWLSNIRMFLNNGWNGVQFEGYGKPLNGVKQEFITKENINDIFKKYDVPQYFDLLSIDIDGNDYWVWKELTYTPNVVIIEYNSNFSLDEPYVLKYNPEHNFFKDGNAYSASLISMKKLGESKGYFLHKEIAATNLIFVLNKFKNIIDELDINNVKLPIHQHNGKQINFFEKIN